MLKMNTEVNKNKLKEKYHTKFRKNINKSKCHMSQLLEKALKEYDNHPAFNPYARYNGATPIDRLELVVLNELIKLYQIQIENKKVNNI